MTKYHIKDVSEIMGISVYTLRYYEKIGVLSFVHRDENGVREFEPRDLVTLNTIECLKKTDMPLKDIKNYLNLINEGIDSADERLQMFVAQKQKVTDKIKDLENSLKTINMKINYYTEVLKKGTLDVCQEERSNFAKELISGKTNKN